MDTNIYNSYAKVTKDTVEIFGQVFPLDFKFFISECLNRPRFYPTGELESFCIDKTIIHFMGNEIPIGVEMSLYKSGKFHGGRIYSGINYELTGKDEYIYEHKGHKYYITGGIYFYESGNIESFIIDSPASGPDFRNDIGSLYTETNFLLEGKKLYFRGYDKIIFYEESGLPKKIIMSSSRNSQNQKYAPPVIDTCKDYNVIEISETGKITSAILEPRCEYEYD